MPPYKRTVHFKKLYIFFTYFKILNNQLNSLDFIFLAHDTVLFPHILICIKFQQLAPHDIKSTLTLHLIIFQEEQCGAQDHIQNTKSLSKILEDYFKASCSKKGLFLI